MAERKVSVRLAVVDGGQFKAEMAALGAEGQQAFEQKIGAGARAASNAVQLNAQQLTNLQFQMQDIGVSLASGQNPFTVMMQQGSQIVQIFGPGTGVLGALKAVGGGLVTFLTNPLNLALLGFSAATAAAGYLFSIITGPGEDANETLEEQEGHITRIAEKYGDAIPLVRGYADEIERANEEAEIAAGRAAAIERAWSDARQGFDEMFFDFIDIFSLLQTAGDYQALSGLQSAFWELEGAVKENRATAEDARAVHDALMAAFRTTGIPALEALAGKFDDLAAAIARANAESNQIGRELSGNVAAAGVLASLQSELDALGKTEEQLRIERELREANVDASSAEGLAIAAKVREIFAETAAQKEAAAAEREAESARRAALARSSAETERARQAVADLIESLRTEIEIAEESDPVQKELIRLRGQMAAATAEERAEIERLIAARIELANADGGDGGLFGKAIDYLKDFAEKSGTAADLIKESIAGAFSSAEEAVGQFVRTGKVEFASLVTSMLADLARLAVRQAVLGPIANWLGGMLGGGGGILASILHDGGVAGRGGMGRMIPAMAFAGARRMHDGGLPGLGPDEVPAILQTGERVLNRRETREYESGGTTVNIYARDAESFRRSRTQIAVDISRAVAFGSRGL